MLVSTGMGWNTFNRQGLRSLLPSSTHPDRRPLEGVLRELAPSSAIVDFGAGGRRVTPGTFTIDGNAATAPDLVSDLHRVALPDASFDAAICTGTLEHVRDPESVGREIARVLRPGGIAYIDVPFLQGFHADPDDFRRWTLPGLRLFSERVGLSVESSGVHIGPGSALSWVASEYVRVVLGRTLGRVGAMIVRMALLPLMMIDRFVARRPDAYRIASGVYVIARKNTAAG